MSALLQLLLQLGLVYSASRLMYIYLSVCVCVIYQGWGVGFECTHRIRGTRYSNCCINSFTHIHSSTTTRSLYHAHHHIMSPSYHIYPIMPIIISCHVHHIMLSILSCLQQANTAWSIRSGRKSRHPSPTLKWVVMTTYRCIVMVPLLIDGDHSGRASQW